MKKIAFFILILVLAQTFATTVAVKNLKATGIKQEEAELISEKIRSVIVTFGEWQVMEREEMQALFDEMQLQQSGAVDEMSAVELGKMIGVQKLITGKVGAVGNVYTLSLKMLNVQTGKVERSITEDLPGTLTDFYLGSVPTAAKKIINYSKETLPEKKVEKAIPKETIFGLWDGVYAYDDKSRDPVPFQMIIRKGVQTQTFTGVVVEPRTFGEANTSQLTAVIRGSFAKDGRIQFVKTYDGSGGQTHSIVYKGVMDNSKSAINGTWDIKGYTGTFILQKKAE